jgi:hypothetical protein
MPGIERCSCIGNRGAGATTSECPMLTSPNERIEPCTAGAGGTTPALDPASVRRPEAAPTSGGGPTAEADATPEKPERPFAARPTSGGGPTTDVDPAGRVNCEPPVADSGMAGRAALEPPRLGRRDWGSLTSGGATRVGRLDGTPNAAGRAASFFPLDRARGRGELLPLAGKDREGA